jgi:hypothetical protein
MLPAIQIPDMAGDAARMYTGGYNLGNQQRQNRLMVNAGKIASTGDMSGAKNALLAGGDFQQADHVQNSINTTNDRELEHLAKTQQHLSNIASTIRTPQEFEKAKQVLNSMGLPTDGYTFEMLPTLRAQATTEADRYNRALDERKMAMAQAQAQQPKTMEVGGSLVRVDPQGGVSELYRAPTAAKQRYMSTPAGVFDISTGQYVSDVGRSNSGLDPFAEKERQKAVGKAQGEAQANLPSATTNAEFLSKSIGDLYSDPKLGNESGWLPGMTGWANVLPNLTTGAQATQARMDQVQGQAFMAAFDRLRGAGAITEAEGSKATNALNRLNSPGMGYDEYRKALGDFHREVGSLYNLAQERAGVPAGQRRVLGQGNDASMANAGQRQQSSMSSADPLGILGN